jgi:hypothetical protein
MQRFSKSKIGLLYCALRRKKCSIAVVFHAKKPPLVGSRFAIATEARAIAIVTEARAVAAKAMATAVARAIATEARAIARESG